MESIVLDKEFVFVQKALVITWIQTLVDKSLSHDCNLEDTGRKIWISSKLHLVKTNAQEEDDDQLENVFL